jgi:hypothetical protein
VVNAPSVASDPIGASALTAAIAATEGVIAPSAVMHVVMHATMHAVNRVARHEAKHEATLAANRAAARGLNVILGRRRPWPRWHRIRP